MGIVAFCPNGHRVKVKDELAGRKGICPTCAARFRIPAKAPPATTAGGPVGVAALPTARVIPIDPLVAASLPMARAIDEAETGATAGRRPDHADAAPDFVLLADEDEDAREPVVAATPPTAEPDAPARAEPAPVAFDERPDLVWYVAIRGGSPSAPLAGPAFRAWLESGAATVDHVVWRSDWPDWRPLGDVFPDALPARSQGWP